MKKALIVTLAIMAILITGLAHAAGSCTQTDTTYIDGATVIKLVCTGNSSNGSIPTITIDMSNVALGKQYLYQVYAYPTAGGTAPDAADVAVIMNGQDLLGGKGVNLIHATATQDTFPYSTYMSMYRFPAVKAALTLTVANQSTASANYTLELVFVR